MSADDTARREAILRLGDSLGSHRLMLAAAMEPLPVLIGRKAAVRRLRRAIEAERDDPVPAGLAR